MRRLFAAVLLFSLCATAGAVVVRPAPNFEIEGTGKSLRSFRGQPVVLVIAQSARRKEFRAQVALLKEMYPQFSTEKVIFVAAIESGPQEIRSDIPFVTAASPQQVAADYGVTGRFAIAVIGVDGNLDMITKRVIPAARVRDMVFNNFEIQAAGRKQPGSEGN